MFAYCAFPGPSKTLSRIVYSCNNEMGSSVLADCGRHNPSFGSPGQFHSEAQHCSCRLCWQGESQGHAQQEPGRMHYKSRAQVHLLLLCLFICRGMLVLFCIVCKVRVCRSLSWWEVNARTPSAFPMVQGLMCKTCKESLLKHVSQLSIMPLHIRYDPLFFGNEILLVEIDWRLLLD